MCHENTHGTGNLEAIQLVSDAITALSTSKSESRGAGTTDYFRVYKTKKKYGYIKAILAVGRTEFKWTTVHTWSRPSNGLR
jgi:hypothetical protein